MIDLRPAPQRRSPRLPVPVVPRSPRRLGWPHAPRLPRKPVARLAVRPLGHVPKVRPLPGSVPAVPLAVLIKAVRHVRASPLRFHVPWIRVRLPRLRRPVWCVVPMK